MGQTLRLLSLEQIALHTRGQKKKVKVLLRGCHTGADIIKLLDIVSLSLWSLWTETLDRDIKRQSKWQARKPKEP